MQRSCKPYATLVQTSCNPLLLPPVRELDLTDCCGLTDAALLVLSKYQRATPPSPPDAPSSPERSAGSRFELDSGEEGDAGAAHDRALEEGSSALGTPVGWGVGDARGASARTEEEGAGGGGEGEDDMLFEMEAAGGEVAATPGPAGLPPRPRRQGLGSGLGGEDDDGGDRTGLRALVQGMLGGSGEAGAGEEIDEEEEEDGRQRERRLAALAALAASAPVSSGMWGRYGSSPGAGGDASLGASPPSSSMAPDTALGAQIARLGLRGDAGSGAGNAWGTREPAGPRGGSGGGGGSKTPQGSSSAARAVPAPAKPPAQGTGSAAGLQSGWIGSWERRGLTLPPWQQARAQQLQQLQHLPSASSSPAAAASPAGTSPPTGGVSTAWRAPPRLTFAAGPGLRSLVLAGCSQVSAEGVRALLAAPGPKASLEALDVSRCQRMTRQALNVPPQSCLRVLKCSGCNNLHEVIIQLPPTCPLTELVSMQPPTPAGVGAGNRLFLALCCMCVQRDSERHLVQLTCPRLACIESLA